MNKVFVLQLLSELKQAQNGVTTARSSVANRMIESIKLSCRWSSEKGTRHHCPPSSVASASVLLCGGIRLVLGLRMGLGVGYRLDMTQCRLSSDFKLK